MREDVKYWQSCAHRALTTKKRNAGDLHTVSALRNPREVITGVLVTTKGDKRMKCSRAIIDWLTFTVRGAEDPESVIFNYLKMDPALFQPVPYGQYGYQKTMQFDGIFVYYDPAEERVHDMGVCVSLTGKGCRTFEHFTRYERGETPFFAAFTRLHTDDSVHFSRVDLAIDDMAGQLDLDQICDAVRENRVNSRIRKRTIYQGYDGKSVAGTSVYFGSESSDFRIRFYDKAKETYKPMDPKYNSHWIRLEIVMRGKNAGAFVGGICNSLDLGHLASGILNDKLAFIERTDTNITRCQICDWWLRFVDDVASIPLLHADRPEKHTILRSLEWIRRQVAPALSLINDARGYFEIRDILALGLSKRTAKQQALLDDYRNAYVFTNDARGEYLRSVAEINGRIEQ